MKRTIRSLTTADVPAILAIEATSFSAPWNAAMFESALQAPGTCGWVALQEKVIVGYLLVRVAADQAEILTIAVHDTHRGGGIGMALVKQCIHVLVRKHVTQIFLEVRASNAAAQRLYERAGFSVIARRRKYYDQPVEDALVMMRENRE